MVFVSSSLMANKINVSSFSSVQYIVSGATAADTLVLSEDVALHGDLTIDCSASVLVFDLNGNTFSVDGNVIINSGKQLEVIDGSGYGLFSAASFNGSGSMLVLGGGFPSLAGSAAVQYEGFIRHVGVTRYGSLPYLVRVAQNQDSIFIVDNAYLSEPINVSRSLTLYSASRDTVFRSFNGASLFTVNAGASLTLGNVVVDGNAANGGKCTSHGGLFLVSNGANLALTEGVCLRNSLLEEGSFGAAVFCQGVLSVSGNAMACQSQGSNVTLADDGKLSIINDYTGHVALSQYNGTSLTSPRIDSLVGECNYNVLGSDSIYSDLDNRYTVKFDEQGGMRWGYAPGIAAARFVSYNHVDTVLFTIGEYFDAPAIVRRSGYSATGWDPLPPASPNVYTFKDTLFVAQYEQNTYNVEWINVQNRTYGDGEPIQGVVAYFYDDDSVQQFLETMVFETSNPNDQIDEYNTVGNYKAWAVQSEQFEDYQFDPSTIFATFSIFPKLLSIGNMTVDTVKMYDTSDTAHVSVFALFNDDILAGDEVMAIPSAFYDDAQPGFNKVVTVHFELTGLSAKNYQAPKDTVVSCQGRILTEMVLDEQNYGINVNAEGYCESDVIPYTLASGEPLYYSVYFSPEAQAQGFVDIEWSTVEEFHTGNIPLEIPANCHFGTYTATLVFRNELNVESAPFEFSFNVNIPVEYLKATFSDVISFDLNYDSLDSYQWYYKGGIVIEGATQSYFNSPRNLKGYEVYLGGMYKGNEIRSCIVSNFEILPDTHVALSVYPNPIADVATVTLASSEADDVHILKIVNAMGMVAMQHTFVGASCSINMQSLPKGNYYVVVDDASQHVIVK